MPRARHRRHGVVRPPRPGPECPGHHTPSKKVRIAIPTDDPPHGFVGADLEPQGLDTLGKTPEREQVIDFTHAYSPLFQAVFAPKGMPVKRWSDLDGKTVSVTRGAVIMRQNPALNAEYKLLLKDSPNFIGVAKGEAALKARLDEIVMEARKNGEIDRLSTQWLGRPAGDLPLQAKPMRETTHRHPTRLRRRMDP